MLIKLSSHYRHTMNFYISTKGGFPMGMKNGKPVYMQSSYAQNHALMQAFNQGNSRQQTANQAASMLLPNLGNNSSVTIQVQTQMIRKIH